MKILILTGKFGLGHMSAARAVEEQFRQAGHQADAVDLFEYAMPEQAPIMYWWFNVLVTYGGVFYNIHHNWTANSSGEGRGDNLIEGLERLLDEYQPDVVYSTHPICSAAMARYKDDNASDLPLITCITDVTCHSEWIHPGTDGYLVASEAVREGLAAKGVDPDEVRYSGERALPSRPPGRRRPPGAAGYGGRPGADAPAGVLLSGAGRPARGAHHCPDRPE